MSTHTSSSATAYRQRWQDRFGGIERLYGQHSFAALSQAHIAVVGLGGVGSWAAEALARTGIGALTLIDLDDICLSNTNRQLHATLEHTGQFKAEILRQRLLTINPDCRVEAVIDFVDKNNLTERISSELDVVIDCIDSVQAKAALINHCKRLKLGLVVTGGAGAQIDPTQIRITDLSRTVNDPLLAKTRSILRRDYRYSKSKHLSIPCVYSTEQLRYPQADGSVSAQKPAKGAASGLNCATGFGSATMVTGSFGFCAAAKAIERVFQRYHP